MKQAQDLATLIERAHDDAGTLRHHAAPAAEALRWLSGRLDAVTCQLEAAEMLVEVKEAQLSIQAELISTIAFPLIEVRKDVLCVPLIGPLDAGRIVNLNEALLSAVCARRTRFVVLDFTGAIIADIGSARVVAEVFRALALLGVRGAISGVSPQLARVLIELPEELEVPAHLNLAAALAAFSDDLGAAAPSAAAPGSRAVNTYLKRTS